MYRMTVKRSFISLLFFIGLALLMTMSLVRANTVLLDAFGRLPVQEGGRIKPMDTLARNSLLLISKKQTWSSAEKTKLPATLWLMELMMRPEVAADYKVFKIESPEVLSLFGWTEDAGKYFSYNELKPFFYLVNEQARSANPEGQLRSVFERQIVQLKNMIDCYQQLMEGIHPMTRTSDLSSEYAGWLGLVEAGVAAMKEVKSTEEVSGNKDIQAFMARADEYVKLAQVGSIGIINDGDEHWLNIGQGLLKASFTHVLDPVVMAYAQLMEQYRAGNVSGAILIVDVLQKAIKVDASTEKKLAAEVFFNRYELFYKSILFYGIAFVSVLIGWLTKKPLFLKWAFRILIISFVVHTVGIVLRIYIQGRPPVTNLYSSAIFVGWGSVLLAMVLERFYKNGLGSAVAGVIGLVTLIIAHNLALSGDTLEMVRAVLDSNFWLSTHVIIITLGYSAMFLAGILAVFGLLRGFFVGYRDLSLLKRTTSMVFAIIAFATLFSFVGTMLGGIWADQSWGRFWGWDPKENGALLIVLWCAIILHARWGKLVNDRGFLMLAVGGNIVTSWSWFGTNMLGVGLHSYGFMDAAFWALLIFIVSQLMVILLSLIRFKVVR